MIGNKIEEFIKKGDRVAIAGITDSNAAAISEMAGKYRVEIVGGYSKENPGKQIHAGDKAIPVFNSFPELLVETGSRNRPNKLVLCFQPGDIYEELIEITKCGGKVIDTVLIVPRISSLEEIEKINRVCRQADINLFLNFTPFDFEQVYDRENFQEVGWYLKELDPDLEESLRKYNIAGGTFLDVGAGPGAQAIELAGRGFKVTGTDISETVIKRVKELSNEVEFLVDDILHSKLDKKFDYILDRGCFHSIHPGDRSVFVEQVYRLLDEDGIFFLKCFSEKERWFSGPYRFTAGDIGTIFAEYFKIVEIKETQFYGRSPRPLHALFAVMKPSFDINSVKIDGSNEI